MAASFQALPLTSHLDESMHPNFPLLRWTPVIGLGPTFIQYDLIVTPCHLQRPSIRVWSYSEVPSAYRFFLEAGRGGTLFNAVHIGFLSAPEHTKLLISEPLDLVPALLAARCSSSWPRSWKRLVIWCSNQRSLPQKTPS